MLRRHTRLAFPASLHFVTTTVKARGNWFVSSSRCGKALEIFEECRRDMGMLCIAYVLMPDHFHALVYQPAPDDDLGQVHAPAAGITPVAVTTRSAYALPVAELMRRFKQTVSWSCRPAFYPEKEFWRRRYDDVGIGTERAFWTRFNYIHNNPVRQRLVERPEEYSWSSARAYCTRQQGLVHVAMDRVGTWIK